MALFAESATKFFMAPYIMGNPPIGYAAIVTLLCTVSFSIEKCVVVSLTVKNIKNKYCGMMMTHDLLSTTVA